MNSIVPPPPPPGTQDLPSFIIQTAHYHKKYDDETTEKLTGTMEIYSSSFNQRFEFLSDKDVLVVPINSISEKNSTQITRNRPKIRINLKNKDNFIFELVDNESRDLFREKIETMLKIQKDIEVLSPLLRRNFTALSGNVELCRLYISLIVRDNVLTPSEFWEGREDVIVEAREAERIPGIVSIEMQPDIFKVKNQKYVVNATTEAKKKLFLLYPSARKAFENSVPSKLSEKEFWIKFARSDYFLSEETDDADVKKINKFRKTEEERLSQEIDQKTSLPSRSFPQLALSHNIRDRTVGQSHRGRRVVETIQTKDADTQKIESRNTESYKVVSWDRLGHYREEQIEEEMKSGKVNPFNSYSMSNSQNNENQLMPMSERGRKTDLLQLDLKEYHNIMEISNHRIIKRREDMKRLGNKYAQNFVSDLKKIENDRTSISKNIKISDIQSVARELASKQSQTKYTLIQEMNAEQEIKNMDIGDSLFQEVSVVNELLRHYWRANPVIGGRPKELQEKNALKKEETIKKETKKMIPKLDRIVRKLEEKYNELEKIERMNTSSKHLFYHLKISINKALKYHEKKMKKWGIDIRNKKTEGRIIEARNVSVVKNEKTTDLGESRQQESEEEEEDEIEDDVSFYLKYGGGGVSGGYSPMTPPALYDGGASLHQFPTSSSTNTTTSTTTTHRRGDVQNEPSSPKGLMDFHLGDGLSPMDEFPQTFRQTGGSVGNNNNNNNNDNENDDDDERYHGRSLLGRKRQREVDGEPQSRFNQKKRKLD